MAKVEVVTEYPGIVPVRAIESREGLLREKSACGFYGTKKYPGDVFKINKPEDFSPRWMEFVEPENLPDGWQEIIDRRERDRAFRMNELKKLENKTAASFQAEVIQLAVAQTLTTLAQGQALNQGRTEAIPSHEINYSSGEMKRGPGRPRKIDPEIA